MQKSSYLASKQPRWKVEVLSLRFARRRLHVQHRSIQWNNVYASCGVRIIWRYTPPDSRSPTSISFELPRSLTQRLAQLKRSQRSLHGQLTLDWQRPSTEAITNLHEITRCWRLDRSTTRNCSASWRVADDDMAHSCETRKCIDVNLHIQRRHISKVYSSNSIIIQDYKPTYECKETAN